MAIGIVGVSHVNVTVPADLEAAAKHFYQVVLGLAEIPKPQGTRQRMGAWYQLGGLQLHLSIEDGEFRNAEVEIIPDPRPVPGQSRFFVRDPGGNLIEITQRLE